MTKHALHNALFAAVIANNHKLVIELLSFLLPCEQLAKLDFGTIKFESTVFTDGEGNERRADAVVTVMSKDKQRIVFLIEHKIGCALRLFVTKELRPFGLPRPSVPCSVVSYLPYPLIQGG